MEITIKATTKEIADLVLAIQGQQNQPRVKLMLDGNEIAAAIMPRGTACSSN